MNQAFLESHRRRIRQQSRKLNTAINAFFVIFDEFMPWTRWTGHFLRKKPYEKAMKWIAMLMRFLIAFLLDMKYLEVIIKLVDSGLDKDAAMSLVQAFKKKLYNA